jgi:hypothetical protein
MNQKDEKQMENEPISGFYIKGKKVEFAFLKNRYAIWTIGSLAVLSLTLITYLFVEAQSASDTFNTTENVVSTWQIEVATTTGQLRLEARSCDANDWYCAASTTCASTEGDGDYIMVARNNSPSYSWKTTQTLCTSPQCASSKLVPDNTPDFSLYPARNHCKSIGGRLPSPTEITCMYNNMAQFGNNLSNIYYWTSQDGNNLLATYFYNGLSSTQGKTYGCNVRCVRGW